MNKYVVKISHVFSTIAEVEAANKEEAIEAGEKWFTSNETKDDSKLFYEGTLDKKNWAVLTIEEYEALKEQVKDQMIQKQSEGSNLIVP